MSKPPKVVIPGLNRGAGIPGGYILGRSPRSKQGPAQLLNLIEVVRMGIQTVAGSSHGDADTASTAASATTSLSTSVSTQISGVVSTNVTQSTSLSQISSSLSGAISSTTSLSTAVSTVISGSISTVNSRIDSLSTAVGGGGTIAVQDEGTPLGNFATLNFKGAGVTAADDGGSVAGITVTGGGGPDPGQSTSLSQISSSLSSEISSRISGDSSLSTVISSETSSRISGDTSLSTVISSETSSRVSGDTSLSTVISASISSANSRIDSLSTAVGSGSGHWSALGGAYTAAGVWDQSVDGSSATITFTGLAGAQDIRLEMEAVTKAVSGAPLVHVSVDNGSNWYTTSGDYAFASTAGVRTNVDSMGQFHLTNATAARDGIVEIIGANVPRAIGFNLTADASHRLFLASTSAINAVRITNNTGGNFTGGIFRCTVRL